MTFLQVILRGISGVGKSTIRRMISDFFVSKGVTVVILSKDDIREESARNFGTTYTYSPKAEAMTSYIYTSRLNALFSCIRDNEFKDCVLICDNTHVNLRQLAESGLAIPPHEVPLLMEPNRPYARALIEVGSEESVSAKEYAVGNFIISRQRTEMAESKEILHEWCCDKGIPMFYIGARKAIEDGLGDLLDQLFTMHLVKIEDKI